MIEAIDKYRMPTRNFLFAMELLLRLKLKPKVQCGSFPKFIKLLAIEVSHPPGGLKSMRGPELEKGPNHPWLPGNFWGEEDSLLGSGCTKSFLLSSQVCEGGELRQITGKVNNVVSWRHDLLKQQTCWCTLWVMGMWGKRPEWKWHEGNKIQLVRVPPSSKCRWGSPHMPADPEVGSEKELISEPGSCSCPKTDAVSGQRGTHMWGKPPGQHLLKDVTKPLSRGEAWSHHWASLSP